MNKIEELKDRVKGLRNYRNDQIKTAKNLEKTFENDQNYLRLNKESQIEFLRKKNGELVGKQEKAFKLRYDSLKKDIADKKEKILISSFKEQTGYKQIRNFAEKENISIDLSYKMLDKYSTNANTFSLLENKNEFNNTLLKLQLQNNSIENDDIKNKVKKHLQVEKPKGTEFNLIDSIMKDLSVERHRYKISAGVFDSFSE